MSKKRLFIGLFVWSAIFVILANVNNSKTKAKSKEAVITKKDFGKSWPFVGYDRAILKCYIDDAGESPVIIVGGKVYGLTGFADMQYGQNDINALNKIWAKDPKTGLHIDLGKVTDMAMDLCASLKNEK